MTLAAAAIFAVLALVVVIIALLIINPEMLPSCKTYPDLHPCTLGVLLLVSTGAFLLLGALFPLPEFMDHMRFAETLCNTTSTGIADRVCCEARNAVCTSQHCGAFDCADAMQQFEDDRYLPELRNQSYAFPHSC